MIFGWFLGWKSSYIIVYYGGVVICVKSELKESVSIMVARIGRDRYILKAKVKGNKEMIETIINALDGGRE